MAIVVICFLSLLEVLVILSKLLEIGPIWSKAFLGLWNICPQLSAHVEHCWGKTTSGQGCHPIGKQCKGLVRRLLEEAFDCLHCPLCQTITLGVVRTAGDM